MGLLDECEKCGNADRVYRSGGIPTIQSIALAFPLIAIVDLRNLREGDDLSKWGDEFLDQNLPQKVDATQMLNPSRRSTPDEGSRFIF